MLNENYWSINNYGTEKGKRKSHKEVERAAKCLSLVSQFLDTSSTQL